MPAPAIEIEPNEKLARKKEETDQELQITRYGGSDVSLRRQPVALPAPEGKPTEEIKKQVIETTIEVGPAETPTGEIELKPEEKKEDVEAIKRAAHNLKLARLAMRNPRWKETFPQMLDKTLPEDEDSGTSKEKSPSEQIERLIPELATALFADLTPIEPLSKSFAKSLPPRLTPDKQRELIDALEMAVSAAEYPPPEFKPKEKRSNGENQEIDLREEVIDVRISARDIVEGLEQLYKKRETKKGKGFLPELQKETEIERTFFGETSFNDQETQAAEDEIKKILSYQGLSSFLRSEFCSPSQLEAIKSSLPQGITLAQMLEDEKVFTTSQLQIEEILANHFWLFNELNRAQEVDEPNWPGVYASSGAMLKNIGRHRLRTPELDDDSASGVSLDDFQTLVTDLRKTLESNLGKPCLIFNRKSAAALDEQSLDFLPDGSISLRTRLMLTAFPGAVVYLKDPKGRGFLRTAGLAARTPGKELIMEATSRLQERAIGKLLAEEEIGIKPKNLERGMDRCSRLVSFPPGEEKPWKSIGDYGSRYDTCPGGGVPLGAVFESILGYAQQRKIMDQVATYENPGWVGLVSGFIGEELRRLPANLEDETARLVNLNPRGPRLADLKRAREKANREVGLSGNWQAGEKEKELHPTIAEIKEKEAPHFTGQLTALGELATAISAISKFKNPDCGYERLNPQREKSPEDTIKPNVNIGGGSGSGKTTGFRRVCEAAGVKYAIVDFGSQTPEGYVGGDKDTLLYLAVKQIQERYNLPTLEDTIAEIEQGETIIGLNEARKIFETRSDRKKGGFETGGESMQTEWRETWEVTPTRTPLVRRVGHLRELAGYLNTQYICFALITTLDPETQAKIKGTSDLRDGKLYGPGRSGYPPIRQEDLPTAGLQNDTSRRVPYSVNFKPVTGEMIEEVWLADTNLRNPKTAVEEQKIRGPLLENHEDFLGQIVYTPEAQKMILGKAKEMLNLGFTSLEKAMLRIADEVDQRYRRSEPYHGKDLVIDKEFVEAALRGV